MQNNSSLNTYYFQLTLYADFTPLNGLFFILCLLFYMTIICTNVGIILIVYQEKSLHQPMYIFICCLSVNALFGTAGFFPRFLVDILSDTHWISRPSCFIQMYVIYMYATCELSILSIMAYDRYIAICQPLYYHSKITLNTVLHLIIFALSYPAFACCLGLCLTAQLPLCGNKLHRLFCSNWPVVKLSCVDVTLINLTGLLVIIPTIFIPLFFVLYTYLRILLVCRRSSATDRGKALQTCLPHTVSFVTFSLSFFCELSLARYETVKMSPGIILVLSIVHLVIPPINNPVVYGLKLPQIKALIFMKVRKVRPAFKL
ncbi:olfactory receptor 6N2-like [Mugil cephalus]|uniref:olfactory receptor 6N2-like n=1 Tax=Mugil cephalus TaxID=48193 RepID=UPI001FB61440|nr:olfactory receptor 6N2-like [Mugil cephalus]